ncbi:DUF4249 domain-containing protein [Pedobacter gandavensis]|uniref:DUF4249 family protein n=1 Tax=Pedobacter gandavensis TaxID=2679963 RepID=A0ABR6EZX6_9SPHI|nr:DUF4249 domain-containing protein [Pedobacter gandavensis]MBB2150511.1 DUF4249 family protein [Pedobacter gandavensis]
MQKNLYFLISAMLCSLFFCKCKDKFSPHIEGGNVNFLVVDGIIVPGAGNTTHMMLSRTFGLSETAKPILETGALVTVELENGASFSFVEDQPGNYYAKDIVVPTGGMCRLKISTKNKSEYASSFIPLSIAPAIDRIGYYTNDFGLQIYVNTHDPANKTRYYRWIYDSTYEYNSQFRAFLKYNPVDSTLVPNDYEDWIKMYRCWQKDQNTAILIASTAKLGIDEINQFPLRSLSYGSIELGIGYSFYLKQYALTKEAYDYYFNLKKVTEQLGGIFSPLPTEIKGNIFCINNPDEPVIGFISASTESTKRQFIERPLSWQYQDNCSLADTIRNYSKAGFAKIFGQEGAYPVYHEDNEMRGLGYLTNKNCIECTTRGGSNQKPAFWPY